jgi:hypothetical protein
MTEEVHCEPGSPWISHRVVAAAWSNRYCVSVQRAVQLAHWQAVQTYLVWDPSRECRVSAGNLRLPERSVAHSPPGALNEPAFLVMTAVFRTSLDGELLTLAV